MNKQKMKMKHIIATIIVICGLSGITTSLFAQGYTEGVNLSYDFMPMKIKMPTTTEKFNGNDFKLNAAIPIFLNASKSHYLLVGGNLEALNFSGTHSNFEVKNVYSISPTVGYSTMLSQKFNLTGLLIPFLNSDFKDVKGSDIRFGAIVRGTYRASANFSLRGSLGYRQQFYGPQYIVLAGFDWKTSEKWRIFGDIPNNATINYNVSQKVNTGFNLQATNTSYRLNNQDRYLKYNTAQPGLFLEYYLSSMWAVRGTVDYSITRNLEIYSKTDKVSGVVDFVTLGTKPVPLNPVISKGAGFKLSLSLRIPERKK
jgi:hypothetical protein